MRRRRGQAADRPECSEIPSAELEAAGLAGSLALAQTGQDVCVQAVSADSCHARRLRELGLFEGKTIRVLSSGNPLICQVGECRIGICRRLARCVAVEAVPGIVPAKSA